MAVAIPVQILSPLDSVSNPKRTDYESGSNRTDSSEALRIWLVSSRKHDGRFVLPKGGVEAGESSRQAAVRELWEEAGLVGSPDSSDSVSHATPKEMTVLDHKAHKDSPTKNPDEPGFIPRARYVGHEVLVPADGIKDHWPEESERERRAFTVEEAVNEIKWRRDIHDILTTWIAKLPNRSHS